MSTTEPFLPHPGRDETIAAADPGAGAPAPAPGFGIDGEEPDVNTPGGDRSAAEADAAAAAAGPVVHPDDDVPFRTPDPGQVRRPGA